MLSPEEWQTLQGRWKAIIGLEASLDGLRISVEGVQSEMEAALRKTLSFEEKNNANRADVSNWNTAKSRVQNALPKVRDFIHRAVWAGGSPERKQLGEIFKDDDVQPLIPQSQMKKLLDQVEYLLKDRQILSAHGVTVHQECKGLATQAQEAHRTLQSNAAANAADKKKAAGGGKFFKSVRKWSGA
jgi:hypothetical protein